MKLYRGYNFTGKATTSNTDSMIYHNFGLNYKSVIVSPGCQLIAYDKPSRKGDSIVLEGEIGDLGVHQWEDRIKSAILTKAKTCIARFFEDEDYNGEY